MNICRLTLITLSLVLIAACGGGGGGGTAAAPTPTSPIDEDEIVNPLAGLANVNVMAENSTTIEAVETITSAMNAKMSVSPAYRPGSLEDIDSTCGPTTCFIPINELSMSVTLPFNISNPPPGLFPIDEASQHVTVTASTVTEGIRLDNGVTLARGNLTATFAGNPLEFRTFAGWIDGSVFFGTTHMLVGGGGG